MSEKRDTPFTDFLKKTKDPDFSKRLYDDIVKIFTGHGLHEGQARVFLWGSLEEIEEEVAKEYHGDVPQVFSYGPPRPNKFPTGAPPGTPDMRRTS